jgi:small ligand-binding sensory domain FIST
MGVNMGTTYWRYIQNSMPYNYWAADAPFIDVGPLLEEHTEPGSIIGITGGGNIGYFIHDRTVTNMDGLINSYPYFQALQAGQAGAYLENMGLDYVLANPAILDQQPYKGQFNDYMDHLNIYYGGKELMKYGAP